MSDHGSNEYARELAAFRKMLDTAEVAGLPRRDVELIELRRLIELYPGEARTILEQVERG